MSHRRRQDNRERDPNAISGCSAYFLAASKVRTAALERADPSTPPKPFAETVAGTGVLSLQFTRPLFIVTVHCCCGRGVQGFQGGTCKKQSCQAEGSDTYTADPDWAGLRTRSATSPVQSSSLFSRLPLLSPSEQSPKCVPQPAIAPNQAGVSQALTCGCCGHYLVIVFSGWQIFTLF